MSIILRLIVRYVIDSQMYHSCSSFDRTPRFHADTSVERGNNTIDSSRSKKKRGTHYEEIIIHNITKFLSSLDPSQEDNVQKLACQSIKPRDDDATEAWWLWTAGSSFTLMTSTTQSYRQIERTQGSSLVSDGLDVRLTRIRSNACLLKAFILVSLGNLGVAEITKAGCRSHWTRA